MRITFHTER